VITSSPAPIPAARSASWKAVGAVTHADREARADECGEVGLEVTQLAAKHQVAAPEHLANGAHDLGFHSAELLRVIHERYRPVHVVGSAVSR
jgi:hypothetical protein